MYYITDDSVSVANFSQLTTYKNEDDSTLKIFQTIWYTAANNDHKN